MGIENKEELKLQGGTTIDKYIALFWVIHFKKAYDFSGFSLLAIRQIITFNSIILNNMQNSSE